MRILREANETGTVAYKKYGKDYSIKEFLALLSADPTTIFSGEIQKYKKDREGFRKDFLRGFDRKSEEMQMDILADIKKAGKYTDWLVRLEDKRDINNTDYEKVTTYLIAFLKNASKIDNMNIQSYKGLSELYNTVKKFMAGDVVIKQKYKDRKDTVKFQLTDKWVIYVPFSFEAERYYGAGTQWCTVGSFTYYQQYLEDSPLFILINLTDSEEKYQFQYNYSSLAEFRDGVDRLAENYVEENYPEMYKLLTNNIEEYYREVGGAWEKALEMLGEEALAESGFEKVGDKWYIDLDIDVYINAVSHDDNSSINYVIDILSGDGYQYFMDGYNGNSYTDFTNFDLTISENNKKTILEKMKAIDVKEEVKWEDSYDNYEEALNDELYEEVKDALNFSLDSASERALEDASYNDIVSKLENYVSSIDYEKLSVSVGLTTSEAIEYNLNGDLPEEWSFYLSDYPYANIDNVYFNEDLEYRLSEIKV